MNYHIIRTDDMLNGDGLRVVIFTSGCSHHCEGCHNPETWDENSGKEFNSEAMSEIIKELDKDYISGITLSGGDPLYYNNVSDVLKLVSEIKLSHPEKTIWLYTGMTWEQIFRPAILDIFDPKRDLMFSMRKEIVKMCDVLVDGRFVQSLADVNCPWVGSTNQRVIDVNKTIASGEIVLYNN